MREILFRGKNGYDWIYGYYEPRRVIGGVIHLIHPVGKFESVYVSPVIVFPKTVGQYTGLCDKNGVKIFEGDIIRFTDKGNDTQDGAVIWDEEHSGFSIKWKIDGLWAVEYIVNALEPFDAEYSEVIGNIYDNPLGAEFQSLKGERIGGSH